LLLKEERVPSEMLGLDTKRPLTAAKPTWQITNVGPKTLDYPFGHTTMSHNVYRGTPGLSIGARGDHSGDQTIYRNEAGRVKRKSPLARARRKE
jgi:hypothetical protein